MANILVLEDEDSILLMMKDVLAADGHRVHCEKDPNEALRHLTDPEGALPDLLLLDVMMPAVSGFEIMTVLGQHERTRDMPIVIFTSRPKLEGIFAGAKNVKGFLTKPFTIPDLRDAVRRSLREAP